MGVCVGFVVLLKDRALFVRQAKGHPLHGQWSIPWGVVDPGESPEAAAVREALEESGIVAEVVGLLGIQELPEEGWWAVVFLGRHVNGAPAPDGIETDGAGYFSVADMDSFTEPFEPWCEWIVRRVLREEHVIIPRRLDNPYHPKTAFL